MEGVFCHLDEVARGGGGFPNQVGYLMRGGIHLSKKFKPPPTILSTTRTTSLIGNYTPLGFDLRFCYKGKLFLLIKEDVLKPYHCNFVAEILLIILKALDSNL